MKKILVLLFLLPLLVSIAFSQSDSVAVTFQVDLTIKYAEGLFDPGTDGVSVRGSFMDEIGMSGDWFPSEGAVWLADTDGDTIYTVTVKIPQSFEGTLFEYKFQINDAIWEGDPNRKFTLSGPEQVLPVDYFDRDSVVTIPVTNTLNFTADLTDIYGTGSGYFDPDQNTLQLEGLDWVGAVVVPEGSNRVFTEDPFQPGIFHTTMVIKGVEGDQTKWKTKAYPDGDFFNWGWEITPDYWYTIQEDGAEVDIPIFKPNVFPIQPPLTEAVTILFQVDMSNAVNVYTGESIDPAQLEFVGVKGQNSVLGSWGGDWLPSDTVQTDSTNRTLWVLNDSGTNGDKIAGDHVWSRNITFPAGNEGGPGLYKYGAYYPGADTINGGYHPMDNEMHGTDHWVNVKVGEVTEVFDYFGLLEPPTAIGDLPDVRPVGFELEQNYPNPFNPETIIRYHLAKNARVDLSVFNILGQKVATLVNGKQNAGSHTITFNGANLASGLYFYKLSTDNFSITRKMLLVR